MLQSDPTKPTSHAQLQRVRRWKGREDDNTTHAQWSLSLLNDASPVQVARIADASGTHVTAAIACVSRVTHAGPKGRARALARAGQAEVKTSGEGKRVIAAAGQIVDVGAAEKSDEGGDEALRQVVCAQHSVVVVAEGVPVRVLGWGSVF
jgi:hypothetical protein